jgi:formylglycine-generating enzyme required for sulfatase activity
MVPRKKHTPIAPEFITLPGGCFRMGDDGGRSDERPAHEVELRPFQASRAPVTNAEYGRFLSLTGHAPPRFWTDARFSSPAQPVVGVSWQDAVDYCAWLSLELGQRCRLPAEAEWEYAARGGQEAFAYPWGAEPPLVGGVSLGRVAQSAPYQAGFSPPNGYGLVDLGFNVHEWCADWYDPDYYARSPRFDPRGPAGGERRASRGGAWRHQFKVSRCAARSSLPPDFRYNDYGFRVFADG